MKVRMTTSISGTINGRPYPAKGEVDDFPRGIAEHLVSNGYAEWVDKPAPVAPPKVDKSDSDIETASADPVVEKAVKATPKARKPAED